MRRGSGRLLAGVHLYEQLGLDRSGERLPPSRRHELASLVQTLVCYRLIDPGSEWRLHRQWFAQSAMGDLLGADYSLVEKNSLYRCLDKLVEHSRRCSAICGNAGRICSEPQFECCCTT